MATIEKNFSPIALMLDSEFLALNHQAFVVQVGFCVANTVTREYLVPPQAVWLTDEGQENRIIEPSTVRWWMAQDQKVSAGVFNTPEGVDRVHPTKLATFLKELVDGYPAIKVYASPAMSDLPLIASLCGGRPWKYNQEADMMILYKLLDPTGIWQPPPNEKAHDAAADAGWQMEYLFNLLALLRENNMLAEGQ